MEELKGHSEIQQVADMATMREFNEAMHEYGFLALPEKCQTHDLERLLTCRRRFRGNYTTTNEADFCEYVKQHAVDSTGVVFINPDICAAHAHLSLGNKELPGHDDHRAHFSPRQMPAYKALLSLHCQNFGQRALLEFVEDWRDHIAGSNNGASMNAPQIMAAIRRVTIKATATAEHAEGNLSSRTSLLANVEASSGDSVLPDTLTFACTPFPHFAERTFTLAIAVRAGKDGEAPTFRLRINQLEAQKDAIATEFGERLTNRITNATVRIGEFVS